MSDHPPDSQLPAGWQAGSELSSPTSGAANGSDALQGWIAVVIVLAVAIGAAVLVVKLVPPASSLVRTGTSALAANSGLSKTQIAEAINLSQSDLPGWRVSASSISDDQTGLIGTAAQTAQFKRCAGPAAAALPVGNPPGELDVSSPTFSDGAGIDQVQLGSDVSIETSGAVASEGVQQVASLFGHAQARRCWGMLLAGESTRSPNGVTATITDVRSRELRAPRTAAGKATGLDIAVRVRAAGVEVPVNLVIYGFAVGRDEVSIIEQGIGTDTPITDLDRLAATLVGRAESHPH